MTQDDNSLELPATPQAVSAARRHVQRLLGDPDDLAAALLDGVVPLTSELVSNAVLHGRAPIAVLLRRQAAGLRVEVRDAGAMFAPSLQEQWDLTEEGGRGVLLVQALASSWGGTAHDVPMGKTIRCGIGPAAAARVSAVTA